MTLMRWGASDSPTGVQRYDPGTQALDRLEVGDQCGGMAAGARSEVAGAGGIDSEEGRCENSSPTPPSLRSE